MPSQSMGSTGYGRCCCLPSRGGGGTGGGHGSNRCGVMPCCCLPLSARSKPFHPSPPSQTPTSSHPGWAACPSPSPNPSRTVGALICPAMPFPYPLIPPQQTHQLEADVPSVLEDCCLFSLWPNLQIGPNFFRIDLEASYLIWSLAAKIMLPAQRRLQGPRRSTPKTRRSAGAGAPSTTTSRLTNQE